MTKRKWIKPTATKFKTVSSSVKGLLAISMLKTLLNKGQFFTTAIEFDGHDLSFDGKIFEAQAKMLTT